MAAHESVAAGGSTNDMAAPETISKAVVQSNVLNSAAVATQGSLNSAAEHINSVHVNNVKIRPVFVILEKAVVREVASV